MAQLNLKEFLKNNNLTAHQLAHAIDGLSIQTVYAYTQGRRNPSYESLQKIVLALEKLLKKPVSINDLLHLDVADGGEEDTAKSRPEDIIKSLDHPEVKSWLASFVDNIRADQLPRLGQMRRVLVVGAGKAGTTLAELMRKQPERGMQPIVFLDDNPKLSRSGVNSFPVISPVASLSEQILHQYNIDMVVIALPSVDGRRVREIFNIIVETKPEMPMKILPASDEYGGYRISLDALRDLQPDDFVRQNVKINEAKVQELLHDKRILVTGAASARGSALIKQIVAFEPKEIVLLWHGENSLFDLKQELSLWKPNFPFSSVVCSVQHRAYLEYIFDTYKPNVVFHAGSMNHVSMAEENPEEAVFINVIGTQNIAEVSSECKHTTHFINLSTKKVAVNPFSTMGATKRLGENIVQAVARKTNKPFISIRLPNILGARGSVLRIFEKQIERGGPVTITDPSMERYFMTGPEAARLILETGAVGQNGKVYEFASKEAIPIETLAKDMIKLKDPTLKKQIRVTYTGLRAGETLYEELHRVIGIPIPEQPQIHDVTSHAQPLKQERLLKTVRQLESYAKHPSDANRSFIHRSLGEIMGDISPEGTVFKMDNLKEEVQNDLAVLVRKISEVYGDPNGLREALLAVGVAPESEDQLESIKKAAETGNKEKLSEILEPYVERNMQDTFNGDVMLFDKVLSEKDITKGHNQHSRRINLN